MFDLEAWCSEHLDGKRKGDEFPAVCPWCNSHGKFSVNLDKLVFRCYRASCESNNVPRWVGFLIAHVERISVDQARAKIGEQATAIEREPVHRQVKHKDRPTIEIPLPDETVLCYAPGRTVNGEPKEWRVIQYLRERVTDATLAKYGVGWVVSGRYWPTPEKSIEVYNRVILPVRCAGINAWTARDATDEWRENPKRPKYTNPVGDWASLAFFGWDQANLTGADLVLVEGPFDVMKLNDHGVNAIGLLGMEQHDLKKISLLFDLPRGTNITVLLDPEVKRHQVDALIDKIPRRHNVYTGQLPPGIDPGKSTREQAWEAIDNARKIR